MIPSVKYLSYFENTAHNQPKVLGSEKKASLRSLIGCLCFAFSVVIVSSFALRAIEDNVNQKNFYQYLSVNAVYAAEAIDRTTLESQSQQIVNIKPGEAITLTVKFKNAGNLTWTDKTVFLKSSTTALKFKHSLWPDPYLPARLQEKTVAPNQIGTFIFAVQAPKKLGSYSGEFMLANDNVLIAGSEIKFSMNVVDDPAKYAAQINNNTLTNGQSFVPPATNVNPAVCSLKLKIASDITGVDNETCKIQFGLPEQGPTIRVGLFNTDKSISIKNSLAWQVYDQNDTLLASAPAGQVITFFYSKTRTQYSFDFIDRTVRTASYLKIKNFNNGLFTVTSLVDSPSWNPAINYNDFSGDLEIRYNNSKKRVWLIESLPLEKYVQGIKETSNTDPVEYLKTMTIAARTYALYHHNKGTKHADEFFDVDAAFDQVYKGRVVQVIMPNLIAAAEATRGIIATHDNELIVAAYFSRSDGRTRSFKEVWKTDVPYLQSVKTPYTAGKELYGHGVGIDATDARSHASKEGWNYNQILKYYYSGIALERIY